MKEIALSVITCVLLPVSLVAERPNIIFCMADDMGWGDPNFNGVYYWRFPANDPAIAQEGTPLPVDEVDNPANGDDSKLIIDDKFGIFIHWGAYSVIGHRRGDPWHAPLEDLCRERGAVAEDTKAGQTLDRHPPEGDSLYTKGERRLRHFACQAPVSALVEGNRGVGEDRRQVCHVDWNRTAGRLGCYGEGPAD